MMAKILKLRRIGDPILRRKARALTREEIMSEKIQDLIANIKHTCATKNYGVGLSAPQIGESLAISVIGIKPTPVRPNLPKFDEVLINPEITKTFGRPVPKWEGCCSVGGSTLKNLIFGQVPRYEKITVKYLGQKARAHKKTVDGFVAHVIQHEIDHLNGVVFTDRADPKSLMMGDEYRARIVKNNIKKKREI